MTQSAEKFFEDWAPAYHLVFGDWNAAIEQHASVLKHILPPPAVAGEVLDCACGIGTQVIGLARAGYKVTGTDLSSAMLERAREEIAARGLDSAGIELRVDDMCSLQTCPPQHYGAVIVCDNCLVYLDSDDEVRAALIAMHERLRQGGKLVISLRDYDSLMKLRPPLTAPYMISDNGLRRIVHQVWDWHDERHYTCHVHITYQTPDLAWVARHIVGRCRSITSEELVSHLRSIGFEQIQILPAAATGFHQPIVTALKGR
ncbi:hypothetical protein BWP39_29135 [Paraburkholderia acidicola]|uniref:Methyltransferase domain-containing protein n=1 Tax=Paraburkholderia acidicola TaxID=1912599 RepID=A0A2A4EUB3_9BURK|nr:class I SAM-dependent methyltransferase [Paraburkholderia acidicola]PCE23746.1 hypothetical protein BWP39_29135 [Paraburkholderia acidicola]